MIASVRSFRRGLWLVLFALIGCSQSTAPPASRYVFEPTADEVTVLYDEQLAFSVRVDGAPVSAVFRRGSAVLATGSSFTYSATQVGRDSLVAEVAGADGAAKAWRIWVEGGFGDRPAPVQELAVSIGPRPGALHVSWTRAVPVLNPQPVVRYLVGLLYDRALTELTWNEALVLEDVPSLEAVSGYSRDYSGLQGAATAWVAVRAQDTDGRLSPLRSAAPIRIPGAYRIEGTLTDADGAPLAGLSASVGSLPSQRVYTTGDGRFVLPDPNLVPEGFRDIDKYVLEVRDEIWPGEMGDLYDFRSDSLGAANAYPLQVVMIRARDAMGQPLLDAACQSVLYAGEFLKFATKLTYTDATQAARLLFKWDHWPVRYWFPSPADTSGPGGFPLAPIARMAAGAWNDRLGGDYFVEVAESALADLEIVFSDPGAANHVYGNTEIISPPGGFIDKVVPRRMLIRVWPDADVDRFTAGVCLHELGHALCIGGHSDCQGSHIMHIGARQVPSTDLGRPVIQADLLGAISDDEVRVVRLLRRLAQGLNMSQYLLD